mgnify:CR=1 FL=1
MQRANIESLTDQAWVLVDAKRFHEAHVAFGQLCELTPLDPEPWMMRGVTLLEMGDQANARLHLLKAIELDSAYADPYLHLGKLAFNSNHRAEALEYANKALALDPDYAEAWLLLGAVQGSLNHHAEAEASTRKALSLNPGSGLAEIKLAYTLRAQKRLSEAAKYLRQALSKQPDLTEIALDLAGIYMKLAQYESAATCYRNILARNPQNARVLNELGNVYMALDDYVKAEQSYRQALELPETAPEAYVNLGLILQSRGDFAEARRLCIQALKLKPDSAPFHQTLATVLEFLGHYSEAIAHCDLALSCDVGFTQVIATKGRILIKKGEYQACYDLLKSLIENGKANAKAKLVFAEAATRLGQQGNTVSMLEVALLEDQLEKTERQQIHAALGRIYDETKYYDQAFAHFKQSNALKSGSFDLAQHVHTVNQLISVFNRDFVSSGAHSQCASSLPVFIVGMPRSGTSLVEQVLASHPEVFGAGELTHIQMLAGVIAKRNAPVRYPQCLAQISAEELTKAAETYVQYLQDVSNKAIRIVDKMPHNFMHLGLIQMLFPNARVIHVSRDPIDTCLSCYTQEFTTAHAYTYDLGILGGYYKQYERLMQHWENVLQIPILHIKYETLVDNQEVISRQLVDFCGLKWNEQVMRFYETRREVATASFDQVRQPLYKKSVQRWRHYQAHLAPLIAALH